ncbi:YggS family pyridoxal phosphate-dependent enzyme [Gammaproteobacteria bacterium]|nr:YggS family pyridoxal phosphate-dependent enzyme [Gammaproteobacteria bacterium]
MIDIKNNIIKIKKNILDLELILNREKNSVILMAVSKMQDSEKIREAYSSGQKNFGENYLQESLGKISELSDLDIIWHYIGKIQSNKSKLIAENYDWIHSVDKISTLKKISDHRKDSQDKINVCIQVNLDNEETKSGIAIEKVESFINEAVNFDGINLRGLMAIPMYEKEYELQYATFMKIKILFDSLVNKGYKLDTLSIGMSSDYSAAIAAGSTIVRIGTSIFGERKK